MFQTEFLFQTINQNTLLGLIPEPLGLLIFGVSLVSLTITLRWVLNRVGAAKVEAETKRAN